jgi:hypothetical protein
MKAAPGSRVSGGLLCRWFVRVALATDLLRSLFVARVFFSALVAHDALARLMQVAAFRLDRRACRLDLVAPLNRSPSASLSPSAIARISSRATR